MTARAEGIELSVCDRGLESEFLPRHRHASPVDAATMSRGSDVGVLSEAGTSRVRESFASSRHQLRQALGPAGFVCTGQTSVLDVARNLWGSFLYL